MMKEGFSIPAHLPRSAFMVYPSLQREWIESLPAASQNTSFYREVKMFKVLLVTRLRSPFANANAMMHAVLPVGAITIP